MIERSFFEVVEGWDLLSPELQGIVDDVRKMGVMEISPLIHHIADECSKRKLVVPGDFLTHLRYALKERDQLLFADFS